MGTTANPLRLGVFMCAHCPLEDFVPERGLSVCALGGFDIKDLEALSMDPRCPLRDGRAVTLEIYSKKDEP